MELAFGNSAVRRLVQSVIWMVVAWLVVACGGSNRDALKSTTPAPGALPTLTLFLADSSGATSNTVTLSSPLTVRALLRNAAGVGVANSVVSFATGGTLTVLIPSSGKTLTDASGIATITLQAKDLQTAQTLIGSADTLIATADVGTSKLTATAGYQLSTTAVSLSVVAPTLTTASLAAYDSTLIKVDVLANGKPYTAESVTVNFSSGCASLNKAVLPLSTRTINGRAQVVYTDKGCATTDTIRASIAGSTAVTANLTVLAPNGASMVYASTTPTDQTIVIKGAGGAGLSETATVTFRALDAGGQPLANQLVNFSVTPSGVVTLQTPSVTTGSDGLAIATVASGVTATSFRVNAAFAAPSTVSALSPSITVTPVLPGLVTPSLSAEFFNIEGWSYDNIPDTFTILIADATGRPVADGTPVTFQADSGAVGSSANAGCTTVNGGCTVNFRSQNPRYALGNAAGKRAGMATITAFSSTALVNLRTQVGIFLSGSDASNVYLAGTDTRLSAGSLNTVSTNTCDKFRLQLEVNDLNFNPMPVGTTVKVSGVSTLGTAGEVSPAKISNVAPHDAFGGSTLNVADLAARQGSVHSIPITITQAATPVVAGDKGCDATGGATGAVTFDVTITTPLGNASSYPMRLTFPTR